MGRKLTKQQKIRMWKGRLKSPKTSPAMKKSLRKMLRNLR